MLTPASTSSCLAAKSGSLPGIQHVGGHRHRVHVGVDDGDGDVLDGAAIPIGPLDRGHLVASPYDPVWSLLIAIFIVIDTCAQATTTDRLAPHLRRRQTDRAFTPR